MNIKELFIKLPEPKNVIIDMAMINKYRSICNKGKDSYNEAFKRIIKGVSLGKKVYIYGDKIIIRYFDINYQLIENENNLVLKNIWRNRTQYKIIEISEAKKNKWNKKHGLTSHYERGKVNE